jgi:hypothetical protein
LARLKFFLFSLAPSQTRLPITVLGYGANQAAGYGQLPRAACQVMSHSVCVCVGARVELGIRLYPLFNKNQAALNFLSPEPEVTLRTVAIVIRVV